MLKGINFSRVSSRHWIGRILRWVLGLIPNATVLPIIQGSMRGKRWIVGSANHGCWLGSYEYPIRKLFEKLVSEGDVVYDIGAHVGYYTLLASGLVGEKGFVVAFEPFPGNLVFLKQHLTINGANNTSVIEGVVLDFDGESKIREGPNSFESTVDSKGRLSVQAYSIDSFVFKKKNRIPSIIKMDIEGSEFAALKGAVQTLKKNKPLIFLSTHGPKVHKECCSFLGELGYTLFPLDGKKLEFSSELLGRP